MSIPSLLLAAAVGVALALAALLAWLLFERRRMRRALEEGRRSYTTLLGNLPGMVYRCRPDALRTMLFASEGCLAITGYAPEDLHENRSVAFATLLHGDDRERVRTAIVVATSARQAFQVTYRLQTADGSERWIWEQGAPVVHHGETVIEGFLTDITDLKRHEAALVEARRRAEEMNRLKSAFLATISHEIRTPLTSIIGFASLLADEVGEAHRELVRYIDQSGQRLLETLNAMIDLSLIEAGSIDLHPRSLDLCHEAEAMVDRMYAKAAAKGLHLRFHADAPQIWAYLDQSYVERILQKLIDNAIKFTERGHVTVGVHRLPGRVEIRVEDTGIGIGEGFLPHLFETFKQESSGNARAYEGTGLGLALTKRLVDLLGGTIQVETHKGRGTAFTVSFPRPEEVSALARRRYDGGPDGASDVECRAHVLVVDPNPMTRSFVGLLLGKWCTLAAATDEAAALRLLHAQRFDLVLLNIDYQDSAGLEMMERLRRAIGQQSIGVIALTAFPSMGEQGVIIDAGFDGYIGLPFAPPSSVHASQGLRPS